MNTDDMVILVTKKQVTASLAKWAIRQSPFPWPHGLRLVLSEFQESFEIPGTPTFDFYEVERRELGQKLLRWLLEHPVCRLRWAVPKVNWIDLSSVPAIIDVSGNDKPDPEHDVIDISALAFNVVDDLVAEMSYPNTRQESKFNQ